MSEVRQQIRASARNIFAENLIKIKFVSGKDLAECVSIYSRMKCQNCGLYGRAILCPPLLTQTYPQFETIQSSIKFYNKEVATSAVFVFKNDGTLPWKRNPKDLEHIEFKKRVARQLKGVENGSAKEINRQMRRLQVSMHNNYGGECISLIAGHCDICPGSHRCPNRENPPCRMKGMPSMEATGLDVYGILNHLDIEYEYPALTYLTQVTCLLVLKNKRRRDED